MGTVLVGIVTEEEDFFSSAVTEVGLATVFLLALCIRPIRREAMAPEATTRIQRGKRTVILYTFARVVAK